MTRFVAALLAAVALSPGAMAAGLTLFPNTSVGVANGLATLDSTGHLTSAQSTASAALTAVTTISASGTSQSLTFASSGNKAYDITKTGNVVLTLTGGVTGQYEQVTVIVRPGAGGFTETLPTGVLWSGGVAPTPSTSTTNVYIFSTPDAGVTVFGSY